MANLNVAFILECLQSDGAVIAGITCNHLEADIDVLQHNTLHAITEGDVLTTNSHSGLMVHV